MTYFIDALKVLNVELDELGADIFKIYCVGGFVLLSYGLRENSNDLDAYFKDGLYLKEVMEEFCEWKAWTLLISNAV